MAFDKGGFVITTESRHIGNVGVSQATLTQIAAVLLGITDGRPPFPPTEKIKTIVAFGAVEKDKIPR